MRPSPPRFGLRLSTRHLTFTSILHTKLHHNLSPTTLLYHRTPSYDHLPVFGCLCYPNMSSTRAHKLAPRSTPCVFLGYPANYRGYRCLDISTGKTILSRHVVFDESTFPYTSPNQLPPTHSFLDPSPIFFNNPSIQFPNALTTSPNLPQDTPLPASHQPDPPSPTTQQPPPLNQTTKPHVTSHTNLKPTSSHPMQPRSRSALTDPNWKIAMSNEYEALLANNTWELVPRPKDAPIIRCMWLFKHKIKADGTLERYKARLVVNGKSKTMGIDCDETFSPVVKPTTIRTVLSLATNYATDILSRAAMSNYKPVSTPVEVGSKLSATDGLPFSDGSLYRSLAGALQYLTITRPDISYTVPQICLFMHAPREPHFQLLKRILCYIKGTLSQALVISPSPSTKLTAYSDVDWGGCPDSRRSTSGYCVYMVRI
ncbi:hypothetical protein OSB04_017031 [Centaurea solstitialis]|uniref:Reverse transcriptase Ty1/copia-type domain-containing protein n=1 Tax=Centaurea solstitialis TaxID=347529 RepID=A0AA38TD61_9ASTR|nr:hypothetical protein OSB04_017031 [Centaurea solstitialis]